jgi:electron transfer flavoprotein beta subunit
LPKRLAAEKAEVTVWDNKVLKLDENTIGLKGSPTQVRRIFSPERAKGEIIGDGVNKPADTANLLVEKLVAKDIVSL